jgi:hypothetical protein
LAAVEVKQVGTVFTEFLRASTDAAANAFSSPVKTLEKLRPQV